MGVFLDSLSESKFLKKTDVAGENGHGVLLTIRSAEQENVALQEEEDKIKWILYFDEVDKGLVLNSTNAQIIAGFLGDPAGNTPEEWVGKKIVLFVDPTIIFHGKTTGGIRVRAPKTNRVAAAAAPAQAATVAKPIKRAARPAAAPSAPPDEGPDEDEPF